MEKITMDNCPICGETHIYNLKIERVLILRDFMPRDLNSPQQQKTFTRIFNCPRKNEKFQGTITLFGDDVKNVEIIDDNNEQ